MTRLRFATGRALCLTAVVLVGGGVGASAVAGPAAAVQGASFVGLAEDPVEDVAIREAEADARADAADAGFVDCWVVDVEVLMPPSLPEPEPDPFPIETVFGARVTISCTD